MDFEEMPYLKKLLDRTNLLDLEDLPDLGDLLDLEDSGSAGTFLPVTKSGCRSHDRFQLSKKQVHVHGGRP
jgi:hypothetical protein